MRIISLIILTTLLSVALFSQPYQGPAAGSVSSGVIVSTSGTMKSYPDIPHFLRPPRNTIIPAPLPDIYNSTPPSPIPTKHFQDEVSSISLLTKTDTLLKTFNGFNDNNQFIPPDPYIAANEYYLIGTVNSYFRIFNRDGASMYYQFADNWFSTLIPSAGAFDPKVIYDHYSKRWVMVWLHAQSGSVTNANYLISVSDDSIPAGTWYNYKLSSTVNGSTPSANWGDYQGVGYDDKNIYITSNQFNASSTFDYCRIRIIPKAALYANTAGPVNWIDIWNIYEPNGNAIFGLRPVRMLTPSDKYYFVAHSRYSTGTFFTVCELSNPGSSNPTMTVTNVPVGTYTSPANAAQLGTANLIDGGGSILRNEPVYKDGKIYLAHSVAISGGSALRYLKIDAVNKVTEEDMSLGMTNYYHIYPAIGVDKMGNVIFTYTRSATTEYAGAFYTIKEASGNSIQPSKLLRPGTSTYYKTYGGTRNRWGDYNGAWVDPTDHNSVWIMSEYVLATNQWGCWIGQVKVQGGGTACKDIQVNSGWNIVSAPVTSTNMSSNGVFPTKTSNVYGYNNNYYVEDTLKLGKGYWVKFGSDQTVQLCGTVTNSTTIPVSQGWNLIGGYDRKAPTNLISSSPPNIISSVFYGYNNNYFVADTINPGKGYWVKTTQNGTINLTYSALAKNNINQYQEKLNELPYFTFIDNKNSSLKLYLTEDKNLDLSYYELPPNSPDADQTDIRFVSNRLVENFYSNPVIKLNSNSFPITIINNTGKTIKLSDNINGKIVNQVIYNNEKFVLEKSSINAIKVSVVSTPNEFNLSQNYPNPFNPVTTINYSVPEKSFIKIKVFDVLGKEVATLVNEEKDAGNYSINFDASNLSSGVYIYKLIVNNKKEFSKKMIVNK